MSPLVQNALAIAACAAAVGFVLWRAWKSLAGRASGCGTGCGSCPSSSAKSGLPTAKALMSIEDGSEARSQPGEPYGQKARVT
ncbi:MAG TPA: FeoB-associated Cys-rich membrane protein [Pirellulaceae bacterium]|nr:FeoB-associated Cys-rich membrane protein [Pirellulaceae bacterium]